MKIRFLIIVGIILIGFVASSSFIVLTLQQTAQQCELLGGKIAGLFSCSDKYPTPGNEPKTGSDCRKIFGKGTTEMYDCLEKIEKVVAPQELTNVYPRIHISILPDSDTELHYVDPDFVTIGPGSQVTWSNYDDVPISLNSIDPDNPWSTAVISPDGYDTLTFDETGIYEYRGSPEIHGFIIVMDDDDSTRHYRDFYFSDWYDQNELNSAGCDKPILSHLSIYSNLLDGEFNGKYRIEYIGLPDGVTQEKFEECVEFILEKRMPKDDVKSTQEHYAIEITGLKDVYIVGERYDFSYIISGYGNSCGSKTVTFPDSNGDTIGSASSASCIANLPMGMFVFDIQKEYGTTYGHVGIKNPGTYTVTVTFDRPSKYFPTTVSKEFRVVEK